MNNVNNDINDDLNRTIEALKHFINIDDCDIYELRKEYVILSSTKHYYDKCKKLLDKYPDEISLGKHMKVYTAYYKWRSTIGIGMSLDSELASKLYSEYCSSSSEIHQYFIKAFNLLTGPLYYNNLIKEVHIGEFDLESNDLDYLAESHKEDIDNRLKNLEKSFEKIISLSKNKKFTDMIDTVIQSYTNCLLTITYND